VCSPCSLARSRNSAGRAGHAVRRRSLRAKDSSRAAAPVDLSAGSYGDGS
jgi:hypothetical protein